MRTELLKPVIDRLPENCPVSRGKVTRDFTIRTTSSESRSKMSGR